jgi:LuxR family maltose regulon positive regulatory protein
MRAQGQMTEIRLQDLRFTSGEISAFMNEVMGIAMDRSAAAELNEKTEGWVTALRLFALSLHHRGGVERLLGSLKGDSRYTRDYLMAEVISHQPRDIQEWLMKTAILERFCAPVCEVVCRSDDGQEGTSLNGEEFLTWLEDADMFVIPLDIQHEWFRFHHLFKEILQDWLEQQYKPDEIAALRSRASRWFADNGYITEALRYALSAGDTQGATKIVEQNTHEILHDDKWHILGKWLSMLPNEITQQSPELLVAQAWVNYFQFQIMNIAPLIDHAEKLLGRDQRNVQIRGEIDFFKGYLHYFQSQGRQSEKFLGSALEKIPETDPLSRGEAELNYSLALHMNGKKDDAIQGIHNWLRTVPMEDGIRRARLSAGLSFIHLLEGELNEVLYVVKQGQEISSRHHIQYSESWSVYSEAQVHYHQNNLDKAADLFNQLVQMRYRMHSRAAIDSFCGMALTYQALQYEDEVQETMKQMYAYAIEMNDQRYTTIASSCQAHLNLLAGDVASAKSWLAGMDLGSDVGLMQWWLEVPRLTECRILIAEGSEASLKLALSKLVTFKQENETNNNHIQLISVYSLMAVAYSALDSTDEALAMLSLAVEFASAGEFIRPFIASGPAMMGLLDTLRGLGTAQEYVGKVLSAFPDSARLTTLSKSPVMVDSLTKRELETLHLLATEMSTEEIAAEMVVSTATVRTHTKHIFSKLDVHSRFEAVQRAKELEII